MAEKYQNGLLLTPATASQCGRTFARWLYEWMTQVIGYSAYDTSDSTWTATYDSGSDGASVASYPERFTAASAAFTGSDVGGYLTITGMTPVNRGGIYRIINIISSTTVELDIKGSMHPDGIPVGMTGLTWRLWRPDATDTPGSSAWAVARGTGTTGGGYSFDVHIGMRATNSYFPQIIISPFASWNNGSHTWSDSKYTTARGIDPTSANVDNCRIWASGDTDRVSIIIRCEDDTTSWGYVYIGEIDAFYSSAVDPKPCVVGTGFTVSAADGTLMLGTGGNSTLQSGGLRWLAKDDLTTLTGYLTFAHCSPSSDTHWLSQLYRRWSQYSREMYLLPLICECRTTGYMELRGSLRRVWTTARDYQRLTPFGANSEYLHTCGGIAMQWGAGGLPFGAPIWYEKV